MKLPPARLAAFLAKPDAALRAALIYGPDAGLVRERFDALSRTIGGDLRDPFRVAELSAASLIADPARLHDETAAMSLTGGRRLVRVRDASDGLAQILSRFLAEPPPGDGFVVIEAGDLGTRSSLRRAFEATPLAVAIPCYADGRRELESLVREVLGAQRIAISSDALAYLTAHLGGDRLASRRELEKLALLVGDGGRIGLEEATAAVGDGAALTVEDAVMAAAEGQVSALERSLERAFQEGEMPVSVLRASMRHFQRLHLAASRVAGGAGEEEAVAGLRPPLFFKLQERVKRQLRLWPVRRAAQALELLAEAEINAKRAGLPPEAVCRDALLRLGRRAASAAMR